MEIPMPCLNICWEEKEYQYWRQFCILVYKVLIDQTLQKVVVNMTLTAPGCGMGPVLVSDVKYRVKKVRNVKEVVVDLVFDPPWSKHMMSEEAQLEAGLFF